MRCVLLNCNERNIIMKRMVKFTSLAAVLLLCLSLVTACGSSSGNTASDSKTSSDKSETSATTSAGSAETSQDAVEPPSSADTSEDTSGDTDTTATDGTAVSSVQVYQVLSVNDDGSFEAALCRNSSAEDGETGDITALDLTGYEASEDSVTLTLDNSYTYSSSVDGTVSDADMGAIQAGNWLVISGKEVVIYSE